MKKRFLSILLTVCLLCAALPAAFGEALSEPVLSWRFSFQLKANPEAVALPLRQRAQGYAALLDSLRFEGTIAVAPLRDAFDLTLSVIPLDPFAGPVSARIWGTQAEMLVSSPLLGSERVLLANASLLEFCAKAYEHLGIPLPYLALLLPYTWQNGLGGLSRDWQSMAASADESGVIPPEAVSDLAGRWENRLQSDNALKIFLSSLGLDTGSTEALLEFFSGLPAYVQSTLTAGEEIRILAPEGSLQIWQTAGRDFARLQSDEGQTSVETALPATENGFLPSFQFRRVLGDDVQSGQLALRILRQDAEADPLLDLKASADSLPLSWPADCHAQASVSLTGALFANIGFEARLEGASDGSLTVELRKPSAPDQPGAVLATLTGSLTPADRTEPVPILTKEETSQATGLYSFTDHSLSDFVGKTLPTLVPGLLRFLFGIPTVACQVVLDDLTDTGILAMFIGE